MDGLKPILPEEFQGRIGNLTEGENQVICLKASSEFTIHSDSDMIYVYDYFNDECYHIHPNMITWHCKPEPKPEDDPRLKQIRESWREWLNPGTGKIEVDEEDGKYWIDFGHNGEPLEQLIGDIIEAEQAKPEPEAVIKFKGKAQKREGIRSANITGDTFDTANYQMNDWNQELEEGKTYTVKVYPKD